MGASRGMGRGGGEGGGRDFLALDFAPLDHSWSSEAAFAAFSFAALWFATWAFW